MNYQPCCAANEEGEDCACHLKPKGAWMICPNCDGEGRHSRHMGSFTMSEFYECFEEQEDRDAYFAGAYDQPCYTCRGTGKVREDDEEAFIRLERDREQELIAETGRNSAGEPCW